MSIGPFRFAPDRLIKHDIISFHESKNTRLVDIFHEPECKQNRDISVDTKCVLLRDDHVVLFAIDCLLALHAGVKKWRSRRRTLRALAQLDERQLHDIGLTGTNMIEIAPWSAGHDKNTH